MKDTKNRNTIKIFRYESPFGPLTLGSLDDKLCMCDWENGRHHEKTILRLKRMLEAKFEEGTSEVIGNAMRQLDEFFARERREFNVPLLFSGTEFQKRVWRELLEIPYGNTVSYGEMARRIGKPSSVRAVANATGANQISIFTPCHRVIGSDNSLTGYDGGLATKRMLLKLEGVI